jgi:hypothetical protein
MKDKRKGTQAEHRAIRLLEAAENHCTLAGGSLGLFDVVAVRLRDVRLIQVKSGWAYLSSVEREPMSGLRVPANVSRESWRFPDRCRTPFVEVL